MDLLTRLRTSLRLRLGRGWVGVRRALRRGSPSPARTAPAPSGEAAPIVVAGCHRSGTSLVRRVLDSHPNVACPAETLFLEPLANVLTNEYAQPGFGALGLTVDQAAADLGAVADRWLRQYAAARGKARWAEKSPTVVHQLPGVDQLFGRRALFLLVARDGMDVAQSLGKGKWAILAPFLAKEPDPYLAAAAYWVDMNEKLLAFRDLAPERSHLLRYEDLIEGPEAALRPVFAFLGEPWDPAVLDFNASPHDGGIEDHYVTSTWKFEDNRGKHRSLPVATQRAMWAIVGPTMARLGYPGRTY